MYAENESSRLWGFPSPSRTLIPALHAFSVANSEELNANTVRHTCALRTVKVRVQRNTGLCLAPHSGLWASPPSPTMPRETSMRGDTRLFAQPCNAPNSYFDRPQRRGMHSGGLRSGLQIALRKHNLLILLLKLYFQYPF